tara:strand:+ start:443 stop:1372 length:930 start_codon:yes stop_codon:yes gene_type:complete
MAVKIIGVPKAKPVRDNTHNEQKLIDLYMPPSTLETVDRALFEFIDEKMNIYTTTDGGAKKVPTIWNSAERTFQIKNDKDLRDSEGRIKLPIITVEKVSVNKDPSQHGKIVATLAPMDAVNGGEWVVAKRIRQDKTALFASANNARRFDSLNGTVLGTTGNGELNYPVENQEIVYETYTTPMPVYVNINYSIVLKAQFQQHINEMLTPFLTRTGHWNIFEIEREGHVYEAFMPKEFSTESNVSDMGEEERMYTVKFDVRVLAYLVGQEHNQEGPLIAKKENVVKVRLPRERVIFEDPHPEEHKGQFYKE